MKERILNYMAYIDQLLADDAGKNEEDYEKIMEEHKLQLTFFMHERLVAPSGDTDLCTVSICYFFCIGICVSAGACGPVYCTACIACSIHHALLSAGERRPENVQAV